MEVFRSRKKKKMAKDKGFGGVFWQMWAHVRTLVAMFSKRRFFSQNSVELPLEQKYQKNQEFLNPGGNLSWKK